MRKKLFTLIALISLVAAGFVFGQQPGKAPLDQARARKAAGDLQGAAEGFERVVTEFAASDRNAAAQALLELGDIFESLGQASRARAAYEKVRNDYKDQATEAGIATDRLTRGSNRATPSRITIRTPYTEDVYGFAISPDGRTLVVQGTSPEGKPQLWRQAVDASQKPEPIAGTEGAGFGAFPFFSPDGKSIGFFAKQKLWQVDLAGGTPKELADAPSPWGATWNGGSILLSGRGIGGPVELLEGGRIKAVTTTPGLYEWPSFLDERQFLDFSRDQRGYGQLAVGATDGSMVSARGLPQAHAATFSRGYILFASQSGSLNALPFNVKDLAASGTSSVVVDRVGREDRFPGIAAFSVSSQGSLAYREYATVKWQMMWMDRTGALLATVGTPDSATPSNPHLAPDGRTVLLFRQVGTPLGSSWIMDSSTGAQRMFQDSGVGAVWSPTGDRVLLCAISNSGPVLVTRAPNSAPAGVIVGAGRAVSAAGGCIVAEDVSPSGYTLYHPGGAGARANDLFALPPTQGDPIPVAQSGAAERNGRFSPDGNWVVYQSNESGRFEIYVQPFPGTMAQRQRVSLGGGTIPQWGRNGRELYFISPESRLMAAAAEASVNGEKRSIEFGTPKSLFNSPLPQGSEYDVDRAADRFLILAPVEESPPIVVLSNWMPSR